MDAPDGAWCWDVEEGGGGGRWVDAGRGWGDPVCMMRGEWYEGWDWASSPLERACEPL